MAELPPYRCSHPGCVATLHLEFEPISVKGNSLHLQARVPTDWQVKPVVLCPVHHDRLVQVTITVHPEGSDG